VPLPVPPSPPLPAPILATDPLPAPSDPLASSADTDGASAPGVGANATAAAAGLLTRWCRVRVAFGGACGRVDSTPVCDGCDNGAAAGWVRPPLPPLATKDTMINGAGAALWKTQTDSIASSAACTPSATANDNTVRRSIRHTQ